MKYTDSRSHYKWCRMIDALLIMGRDESEKGQKKVQEQLYRLEHYWDGYEENKQ